MVTSGRTHYTKTLQVCVVSQRYSVLYFQEIVELCIILYEVVDLCMVTRLYFLSDKVVELSMLKFPTLKVVELSKLKFFMFPFLK